MKPANIMLAYDAGDRAVLLDFGIAKGLSAPGGNLSISGHIVGSPQWASALEAARVAGTRQD